MSNRSRNQLSRRDIFRGGGATAVGLLGGVGAAAAATPRQPATPDVYTRIGVRPFINLTAAYTINGGLLTLPEVKQAMEEASYFSVHLDELMEAVGKRISELLRCEAAIVTSGCAAALTHATAACVAGGDPELIQQLPDLAGLRNEVIMPKPSRNTYDHAIRALNVKVVTVDSREEFHRALSHRTAMIAVLGAGEARGKVRLEEMAEAGRGRDVPVLVDAAAEWPQSPDPYLSRGASLVAYSGGKIYQGPQCSGFLVGRQDLIRAAWLNSAPHHAFGRMMKVGKEEIMGALAAMEVMHSRRQHEQELSLWNSWLERIGDRLRPIPGLRTELAKPVGTNPHPYLKVSWDPGKIALTAGELHDILMEGEPRMQTLASGDGHSFNLRVSGLRAEQIDVVAGRLHEVFRAAPGGGEKRAAPPVADISGRWDAELSFVRGASRHLLFFEVKDNQVTGTHRGRNTLGELEGEINGDRVRFRSRLPYEGSNLNYLFTGRFRGGTISGEVSLGEYGSATWTARRTA